MAKKAKKKQKSQKDSLVPLPAVRNMASWEFRYNGLHFNVGKFGNGRFEKTAKVRRKV